MLCLIKKFIILNRTNQIAFVEAYLLLGLLRLAILTLPFKWLTRSLVQCSESDISISSLNGAQREVVALVARAIPRAARFTPWESVCLPQALAAYKMLDRRGISGLFYLGLRKDEGGSEPLEAHAWSQAGDVIVSGESGCESFTVVSVFTWGQS